MRLIDADELKKGLKDLKAEGYNQKYVQGLQDAIDNYFPQIIDDAPTADVQLVKHGRWTWASNAPHREHGAYKCSNCGCYSDFEENYCPNCGCKQDLIGDSE